MTLLGLPTYAVVFVVIAGTELIDRTNFALIGLAAKYSPARVWAGASAAFLVTTGLAVVIGAALLDALHGQTVYLRLGGGVFLIGYAAFLALRPEHAREMHAARTAFATAFLVILLLELGDTTMILVVVFVGALADPLFVGIASAAALVSVAASAAIIGSKLGAKIEPAVLERAVVGILAIVGVVTIISAVEPGILPNVLS